MTTFLENEAAAIEATRALCGNKEVASTFSDADFAVVAADRAAYYTERAASVKSDTAKAKWAALAAIWAQA